MYSAKPLIHGFPGKSKSHGAFGWSSLWLLRKPDSRVLIDTGPFAYMPLIHQGLANIGLTPNDITDVLLTHLHWDHVANFTMFPNATLWVGEDELNWAKQQQAGTHFLSDLHVRGLLQAGDRLQRLRPGVQLLEGISSIATPGHTPGHLAFHAETDAGDHIFAGDSVKNAHELATSLVDSTMDADLSRASIERLRSLLRDTSGRLIPGHDAPLMMTKSVIEREAGQVVEMSYFDGSYSGECELRIPIPAGQPSKESDSRHVVK